MNAKKLEGAREEGMQKAGKDLGESMKRVARNQAGKKAEMYQGTMQECRQKRVG